MLIIYLKPHDKFLTQNELVKSEEKIKENLNEGN